MNKKLFIPLAILVAVIVAGGAYFVLGKSSSSNNQEVPEGVVEESVPTMKPEEIGLVMVVRPDKKAVKFRIEKADGIDKIEYDLSYEADLPASARSSEDGDGGGRISRGVTGEAVLSGKSSYESKYLDLGSCSSGTCRYDSGVSNVNLVIKLTKTDGKVYQVEDTVDL